MPDPRVRWRPRALRAPELRLLRELQRSAHRGSVAALASRCGLSEGKCWNALAGLVEQRLCVLIPGEFPWVKLTAAGFRRRP